MTVHEHRRDRLDSDALVRNGSERGSRTSGTTADVERPVDGRRERKVVSNGGDDRVVNRRPRKRIGGGYARALVHALRWWLRQSPQCCILPRGWGLPKSSSRAQGRPDWRWRCG